MRQSKKKELKKMLRTFEKHLLPQFVNTIQSNLFTECIQNQFLFLKDCISIHVGPNCEL